MLRQRRRFRRTATTVEELNQAIIEKERENEVYADEAFALIRKIAEAVAGPHSKLRVVYENDEELWDFADLGVMHINARMLRKASSMMTRAADLMENAVEARRDMFELEDELSELKKVQRPESEDYLKLTEGVVRRRTRRQDG